MLKTLLLILPVFVPSWRFFKTIEPSPRVQWAILKTADTMPSAWHEFRPRPQTITPFQMILRLFWNPKWNDALFVVSCAERIALSPTPHSINEINQRILNDLDQASIKSGCEFMQFRLMFVHRRDADIIQDIVFTSEAVPVFQHRPL